MIRTANAKALYLFSYELSESLRLLQRFICRAENREAKMRVVEGRGQNPRNS